MPPVRPIFVARVRDVLRAVAHRVGRAWRWQHGVRVRRAAEAGVRHAPHLVSVWISGSTALVVAALVGLLTYRYLLRSPVGASAQPAEVVRVTLALLAAAGVVLAGVYAYRKQRISEGDAKRADAEHLTHRYTTAAEQLGHDKAAVRLAGAFAMSRLTDDWPDQRQVCIDVLCAYLRMPDRSATTSGEDTGEQLLRASILRAIAAHLQANAPINWSDCDFDFTGAHLQDVNFARTKFAGRNTSFAGAQFSGEKISFDEAQFSGENALFDGAQFSSVKTRFYGTKFSGGYTSFDRAKFGSAHTSFFGSAFSGGYTGFNDAQFSGESTSFERVQFSGGYISFLCARFNSAGTTFNEAYFSGGEASFTGVHFSGKSTAFVLVKFSGAMIGFEAARFASETTTFERSQFSGPMTSFSCAEFTGGTGADEATRQAHFSSPDTDWGPITPRDTSRGPTTE